MRKLIGTKQKMTQVFKDGQAFGVTPIKLAENANIEGLEAGMKVKISGTSKGHGFSGVVKMWNFRGGPKTHGNKHHERMPGSIGSTDMARVVPGRKMAGRYGMERISYKGISIVDIDADNKVVMLHGSAPGITGREVEIYAELEGPAVMEEETKAEEKAEEVVEGETEDTPKEEAPEEKAEEAKDEEAEEKKEDKKDDK